MDFGADRAARGEEIELGAELEGGDRATALRRDGVALN